MKEDRNATNPDQVEFLLKDVHEQRNGVTSKEKGDAAVDAEGAMKKIQFSSTCSTYMTLLGFSLGMSDFWRFPFLAYRNGGGLYMTRQSFYTILYNLYLNLRMLALV